MVMWKMMAQKMPQLWLCEAPNQVFPHICIKDEENLGEIPNQLFLLWLNMTQQGYML
jgi:hypothetical protein